jgi:hypothetical protein
VKLVRRWTSSRKEYLVHFAGVDKEVLDGQNSPRGIREVPRAVGS